MEPLDRRRRRVSVGIAGAGGDDRDARLNGREERSRARRPRTVMGDLQQVDRWEASSDELGINAFLDVTRKEEPVLPDLAQEHDRDVVDRRPTVGRPLGYAVRVRPEDPKSDPVEAQAVARRETAARWATGGQRRCPSSITGARPDHARLVHATDPVARQQCGQARNVVLVRVGEHQDVDATIPRRQSLIERDEEASRVGPAVDEEPAAPTTLDEDPVALADVEDHDPHEPVRVMRQRDGQRHRGGGQRDRRHAHCPGIAGSSIAPPFEATNAGAAA